MGLGSATQRGGGRKVRALPRKFVPDPWKCSKSLCKKVRVSFSFPYAGTSDAVDVALHCLKTFLLQHRSFLLPRRLGKLLQKSRKK